MLTISWILMEEMKCYKKYTRLGMGILSLTYITKLSVCVCVYLYYVYIYT